jgi:hypothetical protein
MASPNTLSMATTTRRRAASSAANSGERAIACQSIVSGGGTASEGKAG